MSRGRALVRATARFLGLWALLTGVEILERAAFAAGVDAGVTALTDALVDQGDDVEPFDVTDVIERHRAAAERA